jgi:hypothetical protein
MMENLRGLETAPTRVSRIRSVVEVFVGAALAEVFGRPDCGLTAMESNIEWRDYCENRIKSG